jgi:hypothetical protein
MRGVRSAHIFFVGMPEEKRPLGRPRRRWKDRNRMENVKGKGKVASLLYFITEHHAMKAY